MTINASDIALFLSGGTTNSAPNASIGGDPSVEPVVGSTNNLFDDVLPDESLIGNIDYRCIYVSNISESDYLYNTKIFILTQVENGSSVQIGTTFATDTQKVVVDGVATGGNMVFNYIGNTTNSFTVNHNSNLSTWASNFKNAINSLSELSDVEVTAVETVGPKTTFTIAFKGDSNNRYHQLLELSENNLNSAPSVEITKTINGGPINLSASLLTADNIEPFEVTFIDTSESSPLLFGTLKPGDIAAIWFKRVTSEGINALENDGVSLRITGTPFL